jgi:hypothetical protein
MTARLLAACCAAAALAAPALAQAQATKFRLVASVAPGQRAAMTVGPLPRGEFHFGLRASSDGNKNFLLTQQRSGGSSFTVLRSPSPAVARSCQGAAGSIFCTGISTPVTPAGRSWTLAFRNRSRRPITVTLTVVWRKVTSAG